MARSDVLTSLAAVAVTVGAVPSIVDARHHAGKPHKPRKAKSMEGIEAIEAKAKAANAALEAGRAGDANALFDTALDAMGDRYRDPRTVDDTGMKLTLAKTEVAKGNMAAAAALKKSVVASRLAQFQQLHPAK